MIALHDAIRSMVFVFNHGDSRRTDVRVLADLVQELQEAAQRHLAATSEYDGTDTWVELDLVLKRANDFKFPEEKKPA
jgi:hypothetical protein